MSTSAARDAGLAAMGAKCTGPIPAGFPDDWAVLVQQARDSNVLCSTVDSPIPPRKVHRPGALTINRVI